MTSRHDSNGENRETAHEIARGRVYIQALLHELGADEYPEWMSKVAACACAAARDDLIRLLFGQLYKKVAGGERWTNLPEKAVGGSERDIAANVPKIISMALKKDIDFALRDTERVLEAGFFQARARPWPPDRHTRDRHLSSLTLCVAPFLALLGPDLQILQGHRPALENAGGGASGGVGHGGEAAAK